MAWIKKVNKGACTICGSSDECIQMKDRWWQPKYTLCERCVSHWFRQFTKNKGKYGNDPVTS